LEGLKDRSFPSCSQDSSLSHDDFVARGDIRARKANSQIQDGTGESTAPAIKAESSERPTGSAAEPKGEAEAQDWERGSSKAASDEHAKAEADAAGARSVSPSYNYYLWGNLARFFFFYPLADGTRAPGPAEEKNVRDLLVAGVGVGQ